MRPCTGNSWQGKKKQRGKDSLQDGISVTIGISTFHYNINIEQKHSYLLHKASNVNGMFIHSKPCLGKRLKQSNKVLKAGRLFTVYLLECQ